MNGYISRAKSKVMNEVKIGDQIWATENLSTINFNNGDEIPMVDPNSFSQEWRFQKKWEKTGDLKEAACCYFKGDPQSKASNGVLYNWFALVDPRGICPEGWRIPTIQDFEELAMFLGGQKTIVDINEIYGENKHYLNFTEKLKSTDDWEDNKLGSGDSNFNLKPYGYITATGSWNPQFKLTCTKLWTQSEIIDGYQNGFAFSPFFVEYHMYLDRTVKNSGIPIRCIKEI